MWAGQVSSPVRLERKEKRMDVRRGKEGQCFPCNFCSQWGFGGNSGFSSTTNNNPGFCASFGFSGKAIFISLNSICAIEAEFKRAFQC